MNLSVNRPQKNLFYIYAPRWIESSAGIKVLHRLCAILNKNGEEAYMVLSEDAINRSPRINGDLFTPLLTKEIFLAHKLSRREAIVIYSETIIGNPLNARLIIRYLLNYASVLGGPANFDKSSFVLAYTKDIAQDFLTKSGQKSEIFFLPAIETSEITFNQNKEDFWLLYEGKTLDYAESQFRFDIKKIESILNSQIEIVSRSGKYFISREVLLEKISRAKGVILFENSSLIIESILSGGIAILMPSNLSRPIIGEEELGLNGIALDLSIEELERAERTKDLARNQYLKLCSNVDDNLKALIPKIEDFFLESKSLYLNEIRLPRNISFINKSRMLLSIEIIKTKGIKIFAKVLFAFLFRRLKIMLRQG